MGNESILAFGADGKSRFAFNRGHSIKLSKDFGNLQDLSSFESYEKAITRIINREKPKVLACDLHPEYNSSKLAKNPKFKIYSLKPIQHHHAHIASCMVDNGLESPVIGVVFDGTGYGTDGNIWGGEFMVADYERFTRMGHVEYLPLPGGALAIKKPYRIAIGYLLSLFGKDGLKQDLPCLKQVDSIEIDTIEKQIERKINSPLTSSCGRLFDAVSALTGVRGEIGYEAQAAIELEMVAYDETDETGHYPFSIVEQDGLNIIKLQDLFSAILCDLQNNTTKARISVKFHNTLARMTDKLCQIISHKTGISQVVLSGGVFQNRLLLRKTVSLLEADGFTVFTHKQVPCNDGGISLGQAVIANFRS